MIQLIPSAERPRERCLAHGPECLSLRECLALLIHAGPRNLGSLGLAGQLLEGLAPGAGSSEQDAAFFALAETSAAISVNGLISNPELPGLGDAARARLFAALELGRRFALYRDERRRLTSSLDPAPVFAHEALRKIPPQARTSAREWLGFVPLHRSGKLGDLCIVEQGVRSHVNVDPGELFARILAHRPEGFFLFHNHPSGSAIASQPDLELTRRTRELSRQLNLRFLGHGIVTALGDHWIETGIRDMHVKNEPKRRSRNMRKLPEADHTLRLQLPATHEDAATCPDSAASSGAG